MVNIKFAWDLTLVHLALHFLSQLQCHCKSGNVKVCSTLSGFVSGWTFRWETDQRKILLLSARYCLCLCLEIFQLYMYMGGNIIGHGITQIAQHSDL